MITKPLPRNLPPAPATPNSKWRAPRGGTFATRSIGAGERDRRRAAPGPGPDAAGSPPGFLADALRQTYFLRGLQRRFERVDFARVCYLSADGPYTRIHFDADRGFCADGGLCAMLAAFDRDDLLRVHKSYAVPVHAIQRFERESMCLRDGTELPVGRTYRDRLFAALT